MNDMFLAVAIMLIVGFFVVTWWLINLRGAITKSIPLAVGAAMKPPLSKTALENEVYLASRDKGVSRNDIRIALDTTAAFYKGMTPEEVVAMALDMRNW